MDEQRKGAQSAEQAHGECEEHLRGLFEEAPAGITLIGLDGRFIRSNRRFCELLGYGCEALQGKHFGEFMHPDDLALARRWFERLERGEVQRYQIECRYLRGNGATLWVSQAVSLVRGRGGEPAVCSAVLQDITEHRRSEEQARYLAAMVNSSDDAIIGKTLDGTIVSWNRGAERLYGYRAEEMIGRSIEELAPSERRGEPLAILERIAAGERVEHYETVRLQKQGASIHVSLTVSPVVDAEGRTIGASTISRDITGRKRAELEARRSSELLEKVFSSIHVLVAYMDRDFNFLKVNEAYAQADGREPAFFMGKNHFELYPNPENEAIFRRVVETGEPFFVLERTFEYVGHPERGVSYWDWALQPTTDAEGRVEGLVLSLLNVTEKTLAKREAQAAARYTRSLIEASLDPLVTIGADGRITDVNGATEAATGYDRDCLVGTDFSDYFTEPERARAGYEQVFREGFVRDYPLEIRHRDGHATPVLYNAAVYRDEAGAVTGVFAAARDISRRKAAEEALRRLNLELEQRVTERTAELEMANRNLQQEVLERQSMQRRIADALAFNQTVINASTIGIAAYRATGECILANEASAQMIGGTLDEVQQQNFRRLASWRESGLLRAAEEALTGRHEVFRGIHVTTTFGKEVWLDCRFIPFISGSEPHLLLIIDDVTERKRAEQAIQELNLQLKRRTADLEMANRELESFSYSVSHDLRTPLRAIDGFSRILLEDYRETLDEEGQRLLAIVRENSDRMGQLIDDILAFSRTGRLEMTITAVDMNALVKGAWGEMEAAAPGRKVRFELEDLPPARGDPALLRRVVTNLLDNALKFTRPRDEALIRVVGEATAEESIYSFQDNGVGFDMRYYDRLFGVFERLHSTGEFPGTGIGLAIIKRIVTRHGGRVWAEGRPGEGATFHFTLPVTSEEGGGG